MVRKIAIVGYGVEGQSAYKFLSSLYLKAKFIIYDQSKQPKLALPDNVEAVLGDFDLKSIKADLIVRTPAIAPYKFDQTQTISSVTQLFFEYCSAPIIGVTGSKGKGTTASLIYYMLSQAGLKVHLLGNIGVAALDELKSITSNDVVIYEMSSFQLWDAKKSPHVAVIVHIEPDHLDVHQDFREYLDAKANIVKYQSKKDFVIYDLNNQYSTNIARHAKGQKIGYPSHNQANFDKKWLKYGEQIICSIKDIKLIGAHNLRNACAAVDAAYFFSQDLTAFARGLADFKGLPHRLQFIKNVDGVKYYDDSIATTIGSTKVALEAIAQPKILILGGSSKGANFNNLKADVENNNVKAIIAIGDEADKIEKSLALSNLQFYNFGSIKTMAEIVRFAHNLAESGEAVILSPACASFGMFKDYKDRGQQFIKAVKEL